MIVRNVKKEDLKAVAEISVNGWKNAYRGIIDNEYLESLDAEKNYQRMLKDYQENGFIVAELNNEVVGFCRYTLENLFSKDSCQRPSPFITHNSFVQRSPYS